MLREPQHRDRPTLDPQEIDAFLAASLRPGAPPTSPWRSGPAPDRASWAALRVGRHVGLAGASASRIRARAGYRGVEGQRRRPRAAFAATWDLRCCRPSSRPCAPKKAQQAARRGSRLGQGAPEPSAVDCDLHGPGRRPPPERELTSGTTPGTRHAGRRPSLRRRSMLDQTRHTRSAANAHGGWRGPVLVAAHAPGTPHPRCSSPSYARFIPEPNAPRRNLLGRMAGASAPEAQNPAAILPIYSR